MVAVSLGLYASPDDLAALNAIKAVLSLTMSGVTHLTFSERVLDARTKANQVPVLDAKLELAPGILRGFGECLEPENRS